MKRSNTTKEEEMQRRHTLEKKRLPKILKQEAKTRSLMFKQSLRLSIVGNQEDERAKLKQVCYMKSIIMVNFKEPTMTVADSKYCGIFLHFWGQ